MLALIEEYVVLVGLLGAILAALVGSWSAVIFHRSTSRRLAALQLLDRYTSPEFFIARSAVWNIVLNDWKTEDGKQECIEHFQQKITPRIAAVKNVNNLTAHQNLSWFLHFWTSVQLQVDAQLVDQKMVVKIFKPHFTWYRKFLAEFRAEFMKVRDEREPDPPWLEAIPKLERLLYR